MPALARCRPFGAPLAILSIAALSTVAFALASPSRPAAVSQSDSRATTSPPDPLPTLYAPKGEVLDIRSVTLDLDRGSEIGRASCRERGYCEV